MSKIPADRRILLAGCLVAVIVCAWLVQFALQTSAALNSVPPGWPTITLTTLTSGVNQPLYVTHAGDGSGRIFIVERPGKIRIYKNTSLQAEPFLDISARVVSTNVNGAEQGLLSVAFPPNYAVKQHFYVYYTDLRSDLVISRFNVSADPDVAVSTTEQIILKIDHHTPPNANLNHNGGLLQFGPTDGYLYLATGDGGGGGDTPNNAQTPSVLLGKMLRIDVETGNPLTYTIPSSNPYTSTAGYRHEIWALGLRNPWRFSFDRLTHDMYIGDVGQDNFEEVDFHSVISQSGDNYGWHILEGFHCYPISVTVCTPPPRYVPPVQVYDHNSGDCAIVGGYVYRGTRFVLPRGTYFYGDDCTGHIWGLRFSGSSWQSSLLKTESGQLSSFGEDEDGNLYVVNINSDIVYRIDSVESNTYLPMASK